MATKLYFHNVSSNISNLPTTNQSALTPATPASGQSPAGDFSENRVMDRIKGSSSNAIKTCGLNGTANLASYFFIKFVSPKLTAQTISAETWGYAFGARENSLSINYPCSGTNKAVYICLYVWRPGTGKVFTVYEGDSSSAADEPSSIDITYSEYVTFSGTSGSVQLNDVLVLEVWFRIDPASYITNMQMVWVYDGAQTETTTSGTSYGDVTAYPAYLETPQDLTFVGEIPLQMTNEWVKIANNSKFMESLA